MTIPARYDDPEGLLEVASVVLIEHGIHPTSPQFELSELAAAVYARGWQYDIDFLSGEFQAAISTATTSRIVSPNRGVGPTPEAAMILALSQALLRETPLE